MTLVIFILILSVLVLVHELGHFIAAKKNGVRVEEFGFGLPPRILGKQVGETQYSLNLLPFGGFVRLTGEDAITASTKGGAPDSHSFLSKSPWQRVVILTAGVAMNFLLAVSLFYVGLSANGFKTAYFPIIFDYTFKFGKVETVATVISDLANDPVVRDSGMKAGEAITLIDGKPVHSAEDVRKAVEGKAGTKIPVVLRDLHSPNGNATRIILATPIVDTNGKTVLGVYLMKASSISYAGLGQRLFSGFLHSLNILGYSTNSLYNLVRLSFTEKSISPLSQSVAGPVGIYYVVGGILSYGGGIRALLSLIDFVAIMSLSLAFINVLPVPALDGGRIVFALIELVFRRRIKPSFEAALHRIGMALLIGLLVLITIKDILR